MLRPNAKHHKKHHFMEQVYSFVIRHSFALQKIVFGLERLPQLRPDLIVASDIVWLRKLMEKL